MQARCDAGKKTVSAPPAENSSQREVGRGGIQDEIEDWLKTQSHRAWWDCKRSDRKTTSRTGVPDFVGVFSGWAFGMEVKRPGKKPTTDQLGELAWMRKAGARTAVVYSKQDAVDFLLGLSGENAVAANPLNSDHREPCQPIRD